MDDGAVEPLPKKLEFSSTICPSGSGNPQFDPSQSQQHAHPLTFNTGSSSFKTPTLEISFLSSNHLFGQQPTEIKPIPVKQPTEIKPIPVKQPMKISKMAAKVLMKYIPYVSEKEKKEEYKETHSREPRENSNHQDCSRETLKNHQPRNNSINCEPRKCNKTPCRYPSDEYDESAGRHDVIEVNEPHHRNPRSYQPGQKMKPPQQPTTVLMSQERRLNETKNLEMLIRVYQIIDEELTIQHDILKNLNFDLTKQLRENLADCISLITAQTSVLQVLIANYQGIFCPVFGRAPEKDLITGYADIIQNISWVSEKLEKRALFSLQNNPLSLHDPNHIKRVQLFAKTLQEMFDRAMSLAMQKNMWWNMDKTMQEMVKKFESKL